MTTARIVLVHHLVLSRLLDSSVLMETNRPVKPSSVCASPGTRPPAMPSDFAHD